jgi:biotin operon repressor
MILDVLADGPLSPADLTSAVGATRRGQVYDAIKRLRAIGHAIDNDRAGRYRLAAKAKPKTVGQLLRKVHYKPARKSRDLTGQLVTLLRSGPASLVELADALQSTPNSVSQYLNSNLRHLGFNVKREDRKLDRPVKHGKRRVKKIRVYWLDPEVSA